MVSFKWTLGYPALTYIQDLDYPAWEIITFGCAFIRNHIEFASCAVLISVIRTFHLNPDSQERWSGRRCLDNRGSTVFFKILGGVGGGRISHPLSW